MMAIFRKRSEPVEAFQMANGDWLIADSPPVVMQNSIFRQQYEPMPPRPDAGHIAAQAEEFRREMTLALADLRNLRAKLNPE